MGAAWRACGARQGHCDGAGIIRGDGQFTFPALPGTSTQLPVTRCQICHHTVAYKPGNLSEVLTGHHRRAHPERSASLPGSRPRKPSAPSAKAATSLPTRDKLAAGLNRRTPAVTERRRSMVTARTLPPIWAPESAWCFAGAGA
jgi:hypothetical protein